MNIFYRHELVLDVIARVDFNFGRNLFVVNEKKQLIGVVSQGDLVRILSKDISVKSITLNEIMNLNPIYLKENNKIDIYKKAHKIILDRGINEIPVVGNGGVVKCVISAIDLLAEDVCEKS